MKFDFKGGTKSIEIAGENYTIDTGDAKVKAAYDAYIAYLSTLSDKEATDDDVIKNTHAFFAAMFGDENLEHIKQAGTLDAYNSMRLATAIVCLFREVAQEQSMGSILAEFGIE